MDIQRAQIILYVRDPAAAGRFWRAVLEREPRLDVPGMTEFELGPGAVLGLMPLGGISRLLGTTVSTGPYTAELYLRVDDPEACHRRAIAAGATELDPVRPRDWGDRAGYVRDPDGTVVAFSGTG